MESVDYGFCPGFNSNAMVDTFVQVVAVVVAVDNRAGSERCALVRVGSISAIYVNRLPALCGRNT